MSDPPKRRRRPAVACVLCRKRKIRCNREYPCNNCIRSRTGDCVFESSTYPPPEQARHRSPPSTSADGRQWKQPQPIAPHFDTGGAIASESTSQNASPAASHPISTPDAAHDAEVRNLRLRVRQLEDQLANGKERGGGPKTTSIVSSSIETTSSKLGGTFYVQCESPAGSTGPTIARSMMHKTRMFGQSHWCVTGVLLIRDIFEAIDMQLQEQGASAWAGIERCKALARFIKAKRTPPWPPLPVSPLPEKTMADALVEQYLRHTESLYRILHVPTFKEQYNILWSSDAECNQGLLMQAKLVLALGAITYDEKFSLRTSAMQWAYEAHMWLSEPKFKSRLDIQTMQTHILLLIAQERLGIIGDSMWIASGGLVRRAIYMGLHRDPARLPDRTLLTCEMHRRLWNTIIELNLQASLGSGGSVFLSMNDFDTEAPGNFDDEQLFEQEPVPKPPNEYTQMTVALALRDTFPQRLEVIKFVNDINSNGSYDETLRVDAQLRAAYKLVSRKLQSCADPSSTPSLTDANLRILDTIMYRYLSAIHVPYFMASMHETKYAYSRAVVIDCALKVWNSLGGSMSMSSAQTTVDGMAVDEVDYVKRQVTCAPGFYMIAAMHSAMLVIMELRAQLKESDGLGRKILRPDLVAVLKNSQEWSLDVIKAGHTNVKGYLLLRIIATQIDSLSRNLPQDTIVANLLATAIDVSETCNSILTEMAEKVTGGESKGSDQAAVPMPTPPDMSGQWTLNGLEDFLSNVEGKVDGWPANYGYDLNEFEWALFDD